MKDREFDEEDRKRVAQTMSEAIPELDQTYLNEITKVKVALPVHEG